MIINILSNIGINDVSMLLILSTIIIMYTYWYLCSAFTFNEFGKESLHILKYDCYYCFFFYYCNI